MVSKQWGNYTEVTVQAKDSRLFPIAFPSKCLFIVPFPTYGEFNCDSRGRWAWAKNNKEFYCGVGDDWGNGGKIQKVVGIYAVGY